MMKRVSAASRLVPALFRFVGADVVRNRRGYFGALLVGYAVVELAVAVRAGGGSPAGFGSRFILALLIVAGPFCRAWLDEDVRLGYAAFWLQKPVGVIDYYLARAVAVIAWSVLATLAVGLAAVPAVWGGTSLIDVAGAVATLGWVPSLLVVLAVLGSALGARNGALFAYGALFASFALPGLRDAMSLGAAARPLEVLLPPSRAALAAAAAVREADFSGALAELLPLAAYTMAGLALAVWLATRVPRRLARSA